MLKGLADIVLGVPSATREIACACSTGGDLCRFEALVESQRPAATPVPAHLQEIHP
jgi:hypothetical protein